MEFIKMALRCRALRGEADIFEKYVPASDLPAADDCFFHQVNWNHK